MARRSSVSWWIWSALIGVVLSLVPSTLRAADIALGAVESLYYRDDNTYAGEATFISPELAVTAVQVLADLSTGGLRRADGSPSLEVFSPEFLAGFMPKTEAAPEQDVAIVRFARSPRAALAVFYRGEFDSLRQMQLRVTGNINDQNVFHDLKLSDDDVANFEKVQRIRVVGSVNAKRGAGVFTRVNEQDLYVGVLSQDKEGMFVLPIMHAQSSVALMLSLSKTKPQLFPATVRCGVSAQAMVRDLRNLTQFKTEVARWEFENAEVEWWTALEPACKRCQQSLQVNQWPGRWVLLDCVFVGCASSKGVLPISADEISQRAPACAHLVVPKGVAP